MKRLIISFIAVFSCTGMNAIWAQQVSVLDTLSEPMVCSFKCSNNHSFLLSNCSEAMSGTNFHGSSGNVNPYTEFDTIISTLKRDPSNPFPLVYKFNECDATCNAASTLDRNRNPIILFNQVFIDKIIGPDVKVKWAVRFIFAHEIGHHILSHTLTRAKNSAENRKRELEADLFAGFVISQYEGTTLEDALQGLASLEPPTYYPMTKQQEDISEYPLLSNRKLAAKEGFVAGQNESARLAQFQRIRELSELLYKANGGSVIFRTLDKMVSLGNIEGAKRKVDQLLKDKEFQQRQLLYMYKSKLLEVTNQFNKAIKVQKQAVDLDPRNQEQLLRLRELLLKGNGKQKLEAGQLDKKLQQLKPINLINQ